MRFFVCARLIAFISLLAACGAGPSPKADAGHADSGITVSHDAGRPDAGLVDGGTPDSGLADAGVADGGTRDAGSPDAGMIDAGSDDGGSPDAGSPDSGSSDPGPADAGELDAGPPFEIPDGGFLVRIAAANLTSGNAQTYDPGHGQRILQGLKPDIVLIQEFNYSSNTPSLLRSFVDATFDAGFSYYRGSGTIPNGVISRFPILDAGEWNDTRTTDREFVWAQLDVPGEVNAWAVSVHLLTADPQTRDAEAAQLLQYISANVPAGDYVIIGGDFNTDSRVEAALTTFSNMFVTGEPWPTDNSELDGGNGATNSTRRRPYDWVIVTPSLQFKEVPVIIDQQTFAHGIVFDSRVFVPLTAVAPAQFGDSNATNMQHMAVMRAFILGP